MIIYVLSLLQIVLESLPISSSGHLIILQRMFGLGLSTEIMCLLNGPTLIMFAFYFYNRWTLFVRHPWRLRFVFVRMFVLGFIAELTSLGFYLLGAQIELGLTLGFLITAAVLYSLRFVPTGNYQALTWWRALIIGAVQGIAVLPGISRLATTLVVGRWLGLAPRTAFLFSCMVQTPILLATFGYGMWATYFDSSAQIFLNMPILGMIMMAMVLAYFLLWWVEVQFEAGKLWRFAYYMLLPVTVAFIR